MSLAEDHFVLMAKLAGVDDLLAPMFSFMGRLFRMGVRDRPGYDPTALSYATQLPGLMITNPELWDVLEQPLADLAAADEAFEPILERCRRMTDDR